MCVLQWMDGWMDGWMDEEEQTTMEQVMITWNTSHMLVNKHSVKNVMIVDGGGGGGDCRR